MANLLFASTADVARVVAISADVEFTKLRGYLVTGQAFVERYIGTPLMTLVANAPSTNAALAELIRIPAANLGLLKFVGTSVASITDIGLMRTQTASQKDAFEWQYEQVRANLLAQGYDGLEALLSFLESDLSNRTEYSSSVLYQRDKTYLIRSASVFDEYYPIGGSRLTFSTLQPALREVEERRLRPILKDRHAGLLSANLTEEQKSLLNASRRALVYATLSLGMRQKLVDVNDAGVQVRGVSQFGAVRFEQPADAGRVGQTLDFFDREAADLLNQVSRLSQPTPPAPSTGRGVQGGAIVGL